MRSDKNTFRFYDYPYSILKILFAFICLSSTTKLMAQRTAEEKQSLCKQEKENLQKLEDKWHSLVPIDFYTKAIASVKLYKAKAPDFDSKTLDQEMNSILVRIKQLKEKTQDPLAYKDMETQLETDKRDLKTSYAVSDYLRQIRLKKDFGERIDPNDNPLQKDITLLEQEKANAEEAGKYLANDIRLNEERIRQLGCAVPDPTNTQCWPGSHAAIDPQTNRVACYCDAGLVWNSTRTACVLPGNVNNGTIPSAINWNGVYTGIYDMIVNFSGGSATYSWINGGHKETGSWTFTKFYGNTASGTWKEDYEDDDKKAGRSGDISVTISENSLHYDLVEDTPKFTWKNGIDPGEGGSSMKKGAQWSGTLQKKK